MIKFFALIIPNLILELAGILILPFVLAFMPRNTIPDEEKLPKILRWLDNHEVYLPDQHSDIDGWMGPTSERIKIGYLENRGFNLVINKDFGFWKTLWYRYRWIGLRNRAYYFKYKVCGFKFEKYTSVWFKHDAKKGENIWYVGDKEGYRKGYYLNVFKIGNSTFFELYLVYRYPFWKSRGLRLRIGWKLRNPQDTSLGEVVPWELASSFWKKLDG